jgi:uncharacterized membrane protein
MTKHRLITLFVIAQALDLVTTVILVGFLGFVELNPVMRSLSVWQFAIGKACVTALVAVVLIGLRPPKWYMAGICALSAIPGLWNVLMAVVEL